MSSEVDDGVLLEDDRVVAGLDGDRVGRGLGLLGGLPTERPGIDRRGVDGGRLRVTGAAVGAHRHGDELRRGPLPGGPDPQRVGDGETSVPVANEPYAVTPAASAAAITARAPSARSSGVASAVASAYAAGRSADRLGGLGQRDELLVLLDVPGDRGRPPRRAARSPSASSRPVDATPILRPITKRRLTGHSSRPRSGGSRCWRSGSGRRRRRITSASAWVAPRPRQARAPPRPGQPAGRVPALG